MDYVGVYECEGGCVYCMCPNEIHMHASFLSSVLDHVL